MKFYGQKNHIRKLLRIRKLMWVKVRLKNKNVNHLNDKKKCKIDIFLIVCRDEGIYLRIQGKFFPTF